MYESPVWNHDNLRRNIKSVPHPADGHRQNNRTPWWLVEDCCILSWSTAVPSWIPTEQPTRNRHSLVDLSDQFMPGCWHEILTFSIRSFEKPILYLSTFIFFTAEVIILLLKIWVLEIRCVILSQTCYAYTSVIWLSEVRQLNSVCHNWVAAFPSQQALWLHCFYLVRGNSGLSFRKRTASLRTSVRDDI